ncbi:MAG: tRNA (adenosine(37)-N6)-threonylcarbamoyltransferase complex dimerization subunit type 1 TsaB [Verrucomicrobiaceae bacterium]|nr:tRNA (adenosine(37)-N6)-threonylcarbamoyltransferase complex dimerization subunit type 1 TsaB [Verrucomicrobiaceae bacterium]
MTSRAVLAIELSTPRGHVALVRGADVLLEEAFVSERSHNSMLYEPLGRALEVAGDALSLVVVGLGPGSYTGVRISIAAAQGLGLSRSVPVIGLPSIGFLSDEADYIAVGDARRGQFYTTRINEHRQLDAIKLLPSEETSSWLSQQNLPAFTSDSVPPLPGVLCAKPSAISLAKLAAELGEETVWTLTERPLEPCYVQEAFITKSKKPLGT